MGTPTVDRWTAIAGDICRPGLGLGAGGAAAPGGAGGRCRPRRRHRFLLAAAAASRARSTSRARRRLLEFAQECQAEGGLRCFSYISTAYVAGDHPGSFSEDQLNVGQGFRNGYERSKFEAEQLVSRAAARLPVQIFRPSIIVGETESGWTASFNVLYPPLKAFQAGAYPALPARGFHSGGRRAGGLRRRRGLRAGRRAGRERRGAPPGGRGAGDHGRSPGGAGLRLLQAA